MQPFAPVAVPGAGIIQSIPEDVMGKLKLDLDQLVVDSFRTEAPQRRSGTVFGEQCTCATQCTCPGCPTCYASCNGSCAATCAASCYGTCDYYSCGDTCDDWCGGGTGSGYDATCAGNYGTCDPNRPCPVTP